MRTTENFSVPVQQVVDGLKDVEFESIVVIGRKENGKLYIASSTSTTNTQELVVTAIGQLDTGEFDDDE